MMRSLRGAYILWIVFRYGLDELVLNSFQHRWLRLLARVLTLGRKLDAPRGQRLREALECLGPIFVKFGQVLSTRRDLLPADIAEELARLQDRVPPFEASVAVATIVVVGRHVTVRTHTGGAPVRHAVGGDTRRHRLHRAECLLDAGSEDDGATTSDMVDDVGDIDRIGSDDGLGHAPTVANGVSAPRSRRPPPRPHRAGGASPPGVGDR